MNNQQETKQETIDTEAIEIKALSLVDATLQTAKASFAELVKESSVDKKSKELKAQLKKITIADVNDKENYNKVKAISKDASKIRIAIEKRRKELKADIITAGKSVDNLANEYQALINPIETDADEKLKVIDDAIEQEKLKAEREAKEKLDNRVKSLIESGIVFTGVWYGIGQIQVGIQMIQEMSDDDYNDLLSKVKIQNEANIAEIKRKDEEAKEFQRIQDQLRLDNEAKQKALQAQEDAINDKLKAIADQEAELARKAQEQKEREELEAKQAKDKAERERLAELAKPFQDLGFTYNFNSSQWSLQVGQKAWTITPYTLLANEYDFEEIKSQIELETRKESDRLAQEEADRQAKQKADAEEQERKRIELQNDTEKFAEYLSALQAVPRPILSDTTLVSKLIAITNLINE